MAAAGNSVANPLCEFTPGAEEQLLRYGVQQRVKAILGLLLPLGLVAAGAAGPTIVGSWDCVGVDANGAHSSWTLRVVEAGGKLSATLHSTDSGDSIETLEPTLEGARFTFKIRINATEVVEVALHVDGDRMEGSFTGKDSGTGTLKAVRMPVRDVSGAWSGEWEVGPDGGPGPHYMTLQQDGGKVTGSAGPTPDVQMAIQNGKFSNGVLTFDISIPAGPMLRFEFRPAGDVLAGTAVLAMNGTERKLKLTAKRAAR